MADLPIELQGDLADRLARFLDVEGKIPRALEALGPLGGVDVVLVDGAGGLRARQLAELGARLTVVERPDRFERMQRALADLAEPGPGHGLRVVAGEPRVLALPDESVDAVVACWSAFRGPDLAEVAEAERVLRPGGKVLAVHDYGRDDVSRLRGEIPEYGTWGRRDGPYLTAGWKIRVIHCWWTFDSIEQGQEFLGAAFGDAGISLGSGMKRPRISYNVAVYHRTRGGSPPADDPRVGVVASRSAR